MRDKSQICLIELKNDQYLRYKLLFESYCGLTFQTFSYFVFSFVTSSLFSELNAICCIQNAISTSLISLKKLGKGKGRE